MTHDYARNFALTDLTGLSPALKELWDSLKGSGEPYSVGDADELALVPIAQEDVPAVGKLLQGGGASIVTSARSAEELAQELGERHYYFHPHTGRIQSFAICAPVIMAFFLANATPSLAAHMTQDFERIVAKGYAGVYVEALRNEEHIAIRLAQPAIQTEWQNEIVLAANHESAGLQAVENSDWVLRSCAIENIGAAEAQYGSFPELNADFIAAFERFQRRLCVRQLVKSEGKFLDSPFDRALEEALLNKARACGYWDDLAFSSFAYSYLILGEADLTSSPNFVCNPEAHPMEAVFAIEMPQEEADIRKRNIKQFGSKDAVLE